MNDVLALLGKGRVYTPSSKAHFPEDPDDAYLLDLAEESHAKYLVTGDKKHLLPLKNWKETQIISPAQASEILIGDSKKKQ